MTPDALPLQRFRPAKLVRGSMLEDPDGEWVKFDAADAQLQARAREQEELKALNAGLRDSLSKSSTHEENDLREDLAAAEADRSRLLLENAELERQLMDLRQGK